jgi:hypothetical protein
MEMHELLPQYAVHICYISCMGPEGVMHGCVLNFSILALDCCQHHVGGVNRVHIVGRES